ncbi:hypothetical protein Ciccas_014045 [Cichlidogyrus casuarinus]|uniref:Uncharacterized protein n=1 Tax=Cichlidogyrus casuarinus TaxID=1844966 RepID=A0ABD2PJ29_9PLAT
MFLAVPQLQRAVCSPLHLSAAAGSSSSSSSSHTVLDLSWCLIRGGEPPSALTFSGSSDSGHLQKEINHSSQQQKQQKLIKYLNLQDENTVFSYNHKDTLYVF